LFRLASFRYFTRQDDSGNTLTNIDRPLGTLPKPDAKAFEK
jgi:hypothetical protein